MVQLLKGIEVAKQHQEALRQVRESLPYPIQLGILQVGQDPASQLFIRQKQKACEQLGIACQWLQLAATTTQDQVLAHIHQWNEDPQITGVVCQLPLPQSIDKRAIWAAMRPEKDVDGLHPQHQGLLVAGVEAAIVSPTARAIVRLIDEVLDQWQGKHMVVVGSSALIGRPLAMLSLARGATVTLTNEYTVRMQAHVQAADILVIAAGQQDVVDVTQVQSKAIVIDVGIHANTQGRAMGDVSQPERCSGAWISSVPGGVGPLTVGYLIENLLAAAQQHPPAL